MICVRCWSMFCVRRKFPFQFRLKTAGGVYAGLVHRLTTESSIIAVQDDHRYRFVAIIAVQGDELITRWIGSH